MRSADVPSCQGGAFDLAEEFEGLGRVRAAGVPAATILVCGRILEALAAAAVRHAGLKPSQNAFDNLSQLADLGLLTLPTVYWAHALRRTTNEARHVLRRPEPADEAASVVFATRWTAWYLRRHGSGPDADAHLAALSSAVLLGCETMANAISAIEDAIAQGTDAVQRLCRTAPDVVLATASSAAATAEHLLDAGRNEAALAQLDTAVARHAGQTRLLQMRCVALSRMGRVDEAMRGMLDLQGRGVDDDEQVGILAGIHKRLWGKDASRTKALRKAHDLYRDGWLRSRRRNAWLGINAAATALWLGRPQDARTMAETCVSVLRERRSLLAANSADGELGTWDLLSLAEAELLVGSFDDSRRTYRLGLDRAARVEGVRDVALEQLAMDLAAMHVGTGAASFIAAASAKPADESPELRIGVTGHRVLRDPQAVRSELTAVLRRLAAEHPASARLILVTPLAEGADRIAAHAVLGEFPQSRIRVIVPMELDDYRTDFADPASAGEFDALLGRAESLTVLTPPASQGVVADRPAAYEACGRAVADGCDVLLAVWDGGPSRGRGGTAEIVAYAESRGRRVERLAARRPDEDAAVESAPPRP